MSLKLVRSFRRILTCLRMCYTFLILKGMYGFTLKLHKSNLEQKEESSVKYFDF